MRRLLAGVPALMASLALVLVMAVPTTAAAPGAEKLTVLFPDFERGLVIMINTTRQQYCTDEVVAWEEAVIDWIAEFDEWVAGGEVGPEPPFPDDPAGGFPEGSDPVRVQSIETGKGALVQHIRARGVDAQIWPMVPDPPGVGPCTDSDASGDPIVGTANFQGNDNDVFGSDTRGNAWGDRGTVVGEGHKYAWRFHVNSRCYMPEDGPPKCLLEWSSFN